MSPAEQQVGISEELKTDLGEDVKTSSPISTSEEEPYDMSQDPIEVRININPGAKTPFYVTHFLRRPSFTEEEDRERMMPLIITDAGKVDGQDATSMSLDDEPGNVKLYNKILVKVEGYPLEKGKPPAPEGNLPTDLVKTEGGEEKDVLSLIPIQHKNTVINGMYPSNFELDQDEDVEFSFALGSGREWTVKQEIGGGQKREDGSQAPPQFVVRYTFREPTEAERRRFRSGAISSLSLRGKDGVKDRRSTNLGVVAKLFDSLILRIEGATINGSPIDVRDEAIRKIIPAQFKKGSVIRAFTALEADLGN